MASKKLLAVLASPHRNGATAAMLDCAVQAAQQAGWQVHTVFLYEKRLAYCTGCRACDRTGTCVHRDGQQELAARWREADAVALAAPTYWANVPAVLKNLFDRLRGAAMEDTPRFPKSRDFAGKRYLLLTSCNTPFPFSVLAGQSRGALRAMEEFCRTAGMKRLGKVAFAGANGKSALPAGVRRRIERCWKRELTGKAEGR